MSIESKKNFPFIFDSSACFSCGGKCCRGERGYVWLKREDIKLILDFLKIDFETLEKKFLKKVDYRFSLQEKPLNNKEFACIFFNEKENKCQIYPARPQQCRSYPFWESLKQEKIEKLKEECPGIREK